MFHIQGGFCNIIIANEVNILLHIYTHINMYVHIPIWKCVCV